MAKAAAKVMLHVLIIVAVIIIVGGLLFMAYRQREGISAECKQNCSAACRQLDTPASTGFCVQHFCNYWCEHANNHTVEGQLQCLNRF